MKLTSEDDILRIVEQFFPSSHPSLLLGRGDDCAILRPGGPLAVTTDIFAENTHFRQRYFTPYDIGFKAAAVNISDVGASGARPTGLSIGLTLTGNEDEKWISEFCQGMNTLCKEFSLALSGGDLSRSMQINICITAWGELPSSLPQGLRRGVAKEGDVIFLVGSIGLARLGFTLLEHATAKEEIASLKSTWPKSCEKHLRPFPLAKEGMAIAQFAIHHNLQSRIGLMDVSDGLARDLPRLLASRRLNLGADIMLSEANLDDELLRYAEKTGIAASSFAFEGGEDYALAGTCPEEAWPELARKISAPSFILGHVRKGSLILNGMKPQSPGFDHFSC